MDSLRSEFSSSSSLESSSAFASSVSVFCLRKCQMFRSDPIFPSTSLNQPQRAHGRLVHDPRGIQSVVLLVSGQGATSVNSQGTVDVSGVVTKLFERVLHVDDDLVRQ